MQYAITIFERSLGFDWRNFSAAMGAAFWRHRFLYAIAATTIALALVVGTFTGNLPDFAVLADYGFYLMVAFWVGGCCFAVIRFIWLAFVDHNPAPLSAFLASFGSFLGNRDRLANGFNGLAAIIIFISGFSVLKGAIAILQPFSWDRALSNADRILHFGRVPHEWLWWLLDIPGVVHALNITYNFWFVVLVSTVFTAVITHRDTELRHQFLMSFMLVWLLGGFFGAVGFSSAGPCYFARLGLGEDYQPLMDALTFADSAHPVWALSTQETLWNGYTGATSGSIGISAFPSMHVASAVLLAAYAMRRSALAGVLMLAFAGLVLLGSIVLAWHYAVDGYAGALISILVWKGVGRRLSLSRWMASHPAYHRNQKWPVAANAPALGAKQEHPLR